LNLDMDFHCMDVFFLFLITLLIRVRSCMTTLILGHYPEFMNPLRGFHILFSCIFLQLCNLYEVAGLTVNISTYYYKQDIVSSN